MLVRRSAAFILLFFLTSVCSLAQKMDLAFVGGTSFVSDASVTFAVPCFVPPASCPPPAFSDHVHMDHYWFAGGSVAVRVLNAKAFAVTWSFRRQDFSRRT